MTKPPTPLSSIRAARPWPTWAAGLRLFYRDATQGPFRPGTTGHAALHARPMMNGHLTPSTQPLHARTAPHENLEVFTPKLPPTAWPSKTSAHRVTSSALAWPMAPCDSPRRAASCSRPKNPPPRTAFGNLGATRVPPLVCLPRRSSRGVQPRRLERDSSGPSESAGAAQTSNVGLHDMLPANPARST